MGVPELPNLKKCRAELLLARKLFWKLVSVAHAANAWTPLQLSFKNDVHKGVYCARNPRTLKDWDLVVIGIA